MANQKITYYHNGLSSFVAKDIEILDAAFDCSTHYFHQTKKKLLTSLVKQFFNLCFVGFSTDVCIIQFAGYHSFLPVLLSRIFRYKTVIVLGGTDTVSFPSINYGTFANKKMRFFTAFSIRKADYLLPVSETLVYYKYTYHDADFKAQGYKAFIKKSTPPYKVIENGYDNKKWSISTKTPATFVTIAANLSSKFGVRLKGIDLILEVSKEHPEFSFYIVGGTFMSNTHEIPSNVKLLDFMPHDSLAAFISDKSFYLQLSMSEGFPNALCEAMLSGCIPIGSNVGAIPEIIGDTGYLLHNKDSKKLSLLLEKAVAEYSTEGSKKCRDRISTNFPLSKRREELVKVIKDL